MIDTNYVLWIIGGAWWVIRIVIDHYAKPEKSAPEC